MVAGGAPVGRVLFAAPCARFGGAANACTATSPGCSGGNVSSVAWPLQESGLWQTILHLGVGHEVGALHFHSHCGCSHTLRQGCLRLSHFRAHMASEHCVAQGLSAKSEMNFGQTTLQCGLSQAILQPKRSASPHRVSQTGGLHMGAHSSLHCGWSQAQLQVGVQWGATTAPPFEEGALSSAGGLAGCRSSISTGGACESCTFSRLPSGGSCSQAAGVAGATSGEACAASGIMGTQSGLPSSQPCSSRPWCCGACAPPRAKCTPVWRKATSLL
mmetsp:Transcript_110224/g.292738  ORF Transcript_110224/g.292738 Transcript_110224/m.292738 type:complete len:273 (+) Transcript_110224:117-935(+)